MTHRDDQSVTGFPVQAFQDTWHAAADAIERDAIHNVDEAWMLTLAGIIRHEAGPLTDLVLSTAISFDTEDHADVARRYVRRTVDRRDRNE
ncbi:MAG: hypothetical protein ACRDJC_21485 [Thermomicrobiales bacterium]